MYCKKCGNELDNEAEFCEECLAAETAAAEVSEAPAAPVAVATPVETAAPAAQEGDKKTGFKKSLIAAILAAVAFILAQTVSMFVMVGFDKSDFFITLLEAPQEIWALSCGIVYILYGVVSLGLCIPALIFGIISVVTFFKEMKANRIKPVVTLVLGAVAIGLCLWTFGSVMDNFGAAANLIEWAMSAL